MKKSKCTEEQIVSALRDADAGTPVPDVCRKLGVSQWTFYQWRKRYGGLEVNEAKRVKELEAEVARLKRIVANQALDNLALKDALSKNW